MKTAPLFLALLALLAGCTSLSTRKAADLSRLKRFYVEQRLSDSHRLDEQIAAELRALGYDATAGVLTMKPDGIDAIVSYEDRYAWDFKSYLIEMHLAIRDGHTDKLLAFGDYHQAKITTKSPAEVIHLILFPLFKTK